MSGLAGIGAALLAFARVLVAVWIAAAAAVALLSRGKGPRLEGPPPSPRREGVQALSALLRAAEGGGAEGEGADGGAADGEGGKGYDALSDAALRRYARGRRRPDRVAREKITARVARIARFLERGAGNAGAPDLGAENGNRCPGSASPGSAWEEGIARDAELADYLGVEHFAAGAPKPGFLDRTERAVALLESRAGRNRS